MIRNWLRLVLLVNLAAVLAGCTTSRPRPPRPFAFPADALALTNETAWVYRVDPHTGRQVHEVRKPSPKFTLRCFVLARATKEFHLHARFDPNGVRPDPAEARRRMRAVLGRSARNGSEPGERIVFPGYANLHEFSAAHADWLMEDLGGAWQSYVQRGNWRMVFPFRRATQEREAERLRAAIQGFEAPVVHIVNFPKLSINHAMVLYGVTEDAEAIRFQAYDPNAPEVAVAIVFDRRSRTFILPPLPYFLGGRVNVYEVYRDLRH